MSSPDEAALRRPGMPTLAGAEDDHPDLAAAGKLFPLDSHNVSLLDKVATLSTASRGLQPKCCALLYMWRSPLRC